MVNNTNSSFTSRAFQEIRAAKKAAELELEKASESRNKNSLKHILESVIRYCEETFKAIGKHGDHEWVFENTKRIKLELNKLLDRLVKASSQTRNQAKKFITPVLGQVVQTSREIIQRRFNQSPSLVELVPHDLRLAPEQSVDEPNMLICKFKYQLPQSVLKSYQEWRRGEGGNKFWQTPLYLTQSAPKAPRELYLFILTNTTYDGVSNKYGYELKFELRDEHDAVIGGLPTLFWNDEIQKFVTNTAE